MEQGGMDFIFPSVFPELGESSPIVPVFWEENGRVLHLRHAHQCPWLDAVQSQRGISGQEVRFPQGPASPLLRTPALTRKALHPDLTWAQEQFLEGRADPGVTQSPLFSQTTQGKLSRQSRNGRRESHSPRRQLVNKHTLIFECLSGDIQRFPLFSSLTSSIFKIKQTSMVFKDKKTNV
ncbi:unnamed protein product [Rangifer tarandus platyrhynchus]|uniref:Uncharacterized protein n=1 Tax=Rangifer tarandus platyrhynchus TaxID=3082113 RepID=A0AC59ZPX7_RANTA